MRHANRIEARPFQGERKSVHLVFYGNNGDSRASFTFRSPEISAPVPVPHPARPIRKTRRPSVSLSLPTKVVEVRKLKPWVRLQAILCRQQREWWYR